MSAGSPLDGGLPFVLPLPAGPVRVRLLREDDLPAFLAYRSDPAVARFQGWAPMDATAAHDFLREVAVPGPWPLGGWLQIGIARVDDDRLVGDIGLQHEAPGQVQLGISLAREAQGRGWARAALGALREALGVVRLRAVCDARNTQSLRLFAALGFVETGREAVEVKGERCTDVSLAWTAAPKGSAPEAGT